MASLPAERATDGGVALLLRGARLHSSHNRPARGIAYHEFADADHAVDHAFHRRVSGRGQRDAIRLQAGLYRQLALFSVFGDLYFAALPAGARLSRGARHHHRGRGRAALARIHGGAALHAQPPADSRDRHDLAVLGHGRRRVSSTIESAQWTMMMVSMMLAGIASQHWDPRTIGAIAGALSSTTAIFWGWAHVTGRLPEPEREGVDPEEIEVHGEPTI